MKYIVDIKYLVSEDPRKTRTRADQHKCIVDGRPRGACVGAPRMHKPNDTII